MRDVMLSLALSMICGTVGVAFLMSPWNGTPAIPFAQWQWYHLLGFGGLYIIAFVMGVLFSWCALCLLYGIVRQSIHGFPPVALNIVEASYRDGFGDVYRLEGLESIMVTEMGDGEGGVYYTLDFQFLEDKPRTLDLSAAQSRASCEALGIAVARFLNVPIKGIESIEATAR